MTTAKISMSVRIDPQIFKAFKRLAGRTGTPLSTFVEMAMAEKLDKEKEAA